MLGSALNCRLHHPSLNSTTGAAPWRPSSAVNARPMAGCTPSTWKKFWITSMPVAGMGAPPLRTSFRLSGLENAKYPVTSWKERVFMRNSSYASVEYVAQDKPHLVGGGAIHNSCCALGNGSGRNRMVLTTLNTAM